MTLILTHISRYSGIHASDLNLIEGDDQAVGQGQKTFEIPFLSAGLTTAGSYSLLMAHQWRYGCQIS